MPLYKKKPIEVEAVQWNKPGDMPKHWFQDEGLIETREEFFYLRPWLDIQGEPGDYILRTPSGSIMVCKPDVFEATYEAVETWQSNGPVISTALRYVREPGSDEWKPLRPSP